MMKKVDKGVVRMYNEKELANIDESIKSMAYDDYYSGTRCFNKDEFPSKILSSKPLINNLYKIYEIYLDEVWKKHNGK